MDADATLARTVRREKTAIRRHSCSRPIALAIADGLVSTASSVLDYGCGHGADVRYLSSRKIPTQGWDPHFRPDIQFRVAADVVNLAYVLNVIEDPAERQKTLSEAFDLARRLLVVAVRVDRALGQAEEFGDGVLTELGTFQKLYGQTEFTEYVASTLNRRPHTAALGIAYVFKDPSTEQQYVAARAFSRRLEYRTELLAEFGRDRTAKRYVSLANQLGRTPLPTEFPSYGRLLERYGSRERLERLLLHHVDRETFQGSRAGRRADILTYLAMLRFRNVAPPPLAALPDAIREDIKAGWKSYGEAKTEAERFLFSIGHPETVREVCQQAVVGKLLPKDLYVHRSAEGELPPMLRLLLFAAKQVVGELEYDIAKISVDGRGISFLRYDDFDDSPHPCLAYSMRVYLPHSSYEIRDYREHVNPPILHRKDAFVSKTYPRFDEFQRLSEAEEALGLLGSAEIGYRRQWLEVLASRGLALDGHRVVEKSSVGERDAG